MTQRIVDMTVTELSEKLRSRKLSAEEAAKAYLGQMEKREPEVGAYLTVTREAALETARKVDQKRMKGEELHPLAGIPTGIKDNICTKGVKTTCASRMLENFVPPYDAAVIERLKDCHIVMLGKLNMDEFAMGSTTENSYYQITKNPRDLTRVPGGSSGGAAACVAAQAGGLLRRGGHEADLRRGFPVRAGSVRLVPGPDRPLDEKCGRQRPGDERYRRKGFQGRHLIGQSLG